MHRIWIIFFLLVLLPACCRSQPPPTLTVAPCSATAPDPSVCNNLPQCSFMNIKCPTICPTPPQSKCGTTTSNSPCRATSTTTQSCMPTVPITTLCSLITKTCLIDSCSTIKKRICTTPLACKLQSTTLCNPSACSTSTTPLLPTPASSCIPTCTYACTSGICITTCTRGTCPCAPIACSTPACTPGTCSTPVCTSGTCSTPACTPGTCSSPVCTPGTCSTPACTSGTCSTPACTSGTCSTPVCTPGTCSTPACTPGTCSIPACASGTCKTTCASGNCPCTLGACTTACTSGTCTTTCTSGTCPCTLGTCSACTSGTCANCPSGKCACTRGKCTACTPGTSCTACNSGTCTSLVSQCDMSVCYKMVSSCPIGEVCTILSNEFLFKDTLAKTGNSPLYDPGYMGTKVHVCRPKPFATTITVIKDKFAISTDDKTTQCYPDTEEALLSYKAGSNQVTSLKFRIEHLESLAATGERMCEINKFAKCTRSGKALEQRCSCFNGISSSTPVAGNASCLEHSTQGGPCSTPTSSVELTRLVFQEEWLFKHATVIHLPSSFKTSHDIDCLKGVTLPPSTISPFDLSCELQDPVIPDSYVCKCPHTSGNGKSAVCTDLASSYQLDFPFLYQHTKIPGSYLRILELSKVLSNLENQMTTKVNHGDQCTPVLHKGTKDIWEFVKDFRLYGKKSNAEINKHINNIVGIIDKVTAIMGESLCGYYLVDYGSGVKTAWKTWKIEFPLPLECVEQPSSVPPKSYCVHTGFTRAEQVLDIVYAVNPTQIPFYLDPSPAMSGCDEMGQKALNQVLVAEFGVLNRDPDGKNYKKLLLEFQFLLISFKEKYALSGNRLCNFRSHPGLFCTDSKCQCGDGSKSSDYVWSDSRKKCLLQFGRPCKECDIDKPAIPYVVCASSLECVEDAECLTPWGYPDNSNICLRVKALPTQPVPRDMTSTLMPTRILVVALTYVLNII